ncbi:synaptophysin-like protein 1 [Sphaerodactylus townsendi]|uniref:synaptophysin-like protein 1 n=1 Tax=Sphaerodactylus townsendi TaxID=933632 RepID=UPI002026B143|nr:synaptophysin-like protein 1 [Sphaerodactylus townsendi]
MERVTQKMSGLQFNLGPAKEPLGFIKALEWFFAIFAFATCGGYSGTTKINVHCLKGENLTAKADFGYPFRLHKVPFNFPDKKDCNGTATQPFVLVGDFSSSAQFFVTFAVFVFLYCIAALVVYLCFLHLYRGAGKLPMIDFIITVVVSFLWLVSTSAWAKGLTDIKTSTGAGLVDEFPYCNPGKCSFEDVRSLGSLNVSVVVGFLNLILWAGNAWFVYKETNLHRAPATEPPNPAHPPIPTGM